jgi:hypothetical protein
MEISAKHFEMLITSPDQLVEWGIPADISLELIPCLARGVQQNGRPRTLHLTHLNGSSQLGAQASVVYTPKGSFLRMVLHRVNPKVDLPPLPGSRSKDHNQSVLLAEGGSC